MEKTIIKPPIAKQIPYKLRFHGHTRIDHYYWLRERDNPEVLAYLEQENDYADAMTAHTKDLREKLYREIRSRLKEDDITIPYYDAPYYYYRRHVPDMEYPLYCRKKETLDAPEEVFLDVNEVAKNSHFCQIGGYRISSNQKWLAYSVDFVGRRIYRIYFKNLRTGKILPQVISGSSGDLTWANDHQTIFYSKQHPTTLRTYQIFRYHLKTQQEELIYEEKDESFSVYIYKSKSKNFFLMGCISTLATEYRYLNADDPYGTFKIFAPREPNHEYFVAHGGDRFFIRTNKSAPNFRIMETSENQTSISSWTEIIPHNEKIFLDEMEVFQDYVVLQVFDNGLPQIHIFNRQTKGLEKITFEDETYTAYISYNPAYTSKWLRFGYQSLNTPDTIYDYHMDSQEKVLKKQQEVYGNFEPSLYQTERVFAIAPDGEQIPISLIYKKGIKRNGQNPLLLEGYGSYGANMDPDFSSSRLSLLNRGFIYAIAHIRGCSLMGRYWYENGKLLEKKNTFSDFIACSEYLIQEKYTSPKHLYALGTSAGGMLMGVVVNMRPDLYCCVIATVPFLDVVTTMLDPSIPLTTSEYDEWGNPSKREYYEYMLSYSPYDNIQAQDYPHILMTNGLHDSQVQYWEPAKWVAKLRSLKTDHNLLLLRTNMHAGHGGASGRYEKMKEMAFSYAFMLDFEGITE